MTVDALAPASIADVVTTYRSALELHEGTINRLNVFPVPDGDTGTNMLRTVESAERAAVASDGTASGTLDAIAKGSLMGARGNSGVILSQVLRAIAAAGSAGDLGPGALAEAFTNASDAAYGAVLRPVEGTLLTVARGAATAARTAADGGADLAGVAVAARDGAQLALEQTPALLPVLAEAGVVDAGGAGLVLLYDAFIAVVAGSTMPETLNLPSAIADRLASALPISTVTMTMTDDAAGDLRYEVMFLLETTDDASIDPFKQRWAEIGDSIVVVGGDGMFNCHIHTDDIGGSIDAAVAVGRPLEIRVTDLREQVGALEATDPGAPGIADDHRNPAVTAVVAVASGGGIASILRSLGVARVIGGGQSMNPSTAELLDGIGNVVGREVIVLPNNSNIVPVAREAAKLAGRAVVVVPTRSIQEGITALVAYDPGAGADVNAEQMVKAISRVTSGEVTRAARDASTPVGEVSAGAWIGLSGDGVVATEPTCAETASSLVAHLVADNHEILTVIEGADVPPGEIEAFLSLVADRFPALEVEHHVGGQPVYPILLSLE